MPLRVLVILLVMSLAIGSLCGIAGFRITEILTEPTPGAVANEGAHIHLVYLAFPVGVVSFCIGGVFGWHLGKSLLRA